MIDLRCERFLIRRKRGRQSGKANEDGKRESESGFPLIRITHNLKQSGAIAAFWGGAPCPVGSQWDQSPYLQIDHHVSARGFASLVLQRPWGPLNRCCPRANTFLFCMNFLKNVLTIASAARFSHQTVEVRSKGLTGTVMYVDQPERTSDARTTAPARGQSFRRSSPIEGAIASRRFLLPVYFNAITTSFLRGHRLKHFERGRSIFEFE